MTSGWSEVSDDLYRAVRLDRTRRALVGGDRHALGSGIQLSIDFHHRLSVTEAALFCQRAEPLHLHFVEEPIRAESAEAYRQLRSMTRLPFAVGEEFSSKWAFAPFIEQGLLNYARLDVSNVGGLTEAKKVAGWCEAHYIDVMPHNPFGPVTRAATIHLAAAIPNFAQLEYQHRLAAAYPPPSSRSCRRSMVTAFRCQERPGSVLSSTPSRGRLRLRALGSAALETAGRKLHQLVTRCVADRADPNLMAISAVDRKTDDRPGEDEPRRVDAEADQQDSGSDGDGRRQGIDDRLAAKASGHGGHQSQGGDVDTVEQGRRPRVTSRRGTSGWSRATKTKAGTKIPTVAKTAPGTPATR